MSHSPAIGAEILSVGDELIAGSHVDLNAPRLARGLMGIGIETKRFTTVPDDRGLLAQALKSASERSAVILVSGGLGPTEDDITRHSAADAGGVSLDFDEETWNFIVSDMKRRGRSIREGDKLSAMFPRGAAILPNGAGTAPGFRMQIGKSVLYFLPGPPGEAEQMLESQVLPDLPHRISGASGCLSIFASKRLHLFGITESELGEKIKDRMMRGRNPRVGDTVRKGTITVNILARAESPEKARAMAGREAEEIRALFPDLVFGEDGTTLQESLGKLLLSQKITVATAESCTGGLVGKLLTDVAGISEVYLGGFISYSNEMKISSLGVPRALLEKHGAVSPEVAAAMAEGVAQKTGAALGLGITGIAGPGGGSEAKPVGLVYEAVSFRGRTLVEKRIYPPGDRRRVRELAARHVLHLARLSVLKG